MADENPSRFDPWKVTDARDIVFEKMMQTGSARLLAAIHTAHPRIMQAHVNAGRMVAR